MMSSYSNYTKNQPRCADVPFDDVVTQMRIYFHLTPSEMIQRYLFNSRILRPGKSVMMYVTELKKLAELLKPMLQDHIVCRIDNKCWQHRVLGEEDLTYKSAMKIVLALQLVCYKDLPNPQAL